MAETEKQAREELEKFLAHTNDDNRSGAPPSSDPDEAKIDKLIAQNVPNQSDVHDGPVAIRPMVTAPKLIGKAPPATAPKPVSAMSSVAPSGMATDGHRGCATEKPSAVAFGRSVATLTGTARCTDMGTEAQQKGVKQMEDKYFVFGVIRYTGETIHVDKENAYTGGESNIELQHVKVDIESERVESMIQRDIKAGRPDPTIEIIAENLTEDEADELVLDKRAELGL